MLRTGNTTDLAIPRDQPVIHIPDRVVFAAEPAVAEIQVPRLIVRAVRVALDGCLAPGVRRAACVVDADGVLGTAVEPLAVFVFPLML